MQARRDMRMTLDRDDIGGKRALFLQSSGVIRVILQFEPFLKGQVPTVVHSQDFHPH